MTKRLADQRGLVNLFFAVVVGQSIQGAAYHFADPGNKATSQLSCADQGIVYGVRLGGVFFTQVILYRRRYLDLDAHFGSTWR